MPTGTPDAKKALILFSPSGKRGRFPVGTTVLHAARELGVDIDSMCGGRTCCGRCQVEPLEGTFAREGLISSPAHLGDLSETERTCLGNGVLRTGNRFSCQAKILGDVRVDVPPDSQIHQQIVRKEYEAHPIELDPVIRLYFTRVTEPDPKHPDGDLQRLKQALERDWGLSGLDIDAGLLQALQSALREGD